VVRLSGDTRAIVGKRLTRPETRADRMNDVSTLGSIHVAQDPSRGELNKWGTRSSRLTPGRL